MMWLLTGSIPLFTVFRIRVRMHAMMLIAIVLILLGGWGFGTVADRLISAGALFGIVLLHEFGHCFAARWVGGDAEEIIMHPLGGLALASPPKRPWPTFVTVAGGPAVNLIICAITGTVLWLSFGMIPWNPMSVQSLERLYRAGMEHFASFNSWGWWVVWIHFTSWGLFVFNLLPVYPLDGGQMLQSILWPKFGYYKSMLFAATTGIVGGAIMIAVGIATLGIFLLVIGLMGLIHCVQLRRMLVAEGPWGFQEEDSPYAESLGLGSYSQSTQTTRSKRTSQRVLKKQKRREEEERAEREQVDQILAKVSTSGMNSLTWWEKRTLKRATERQRKRDVALREEMKQKGF